ncbi:MAG TPA: iron-sulfur cluster assembly accessory protein [Kofleriaceae bacterium]
MSATSSNTGNSAPPVASTPEKAVEKTIGKREVEITTAAADEILGQRTKRGTPEARIRLGVRGGGCTGFTYVFEWADTPRPTDHVFSGTAKTGEVVGVVIDPKSLVYLGGMQLDYTRGMMGHGFKFNNPNAKGACGCGESVNF